MTRHYRITVDGAVVAVRHNIEDAAREHDRQKVMNPGARVGIIFPGSEG